MQSSKVLLFLVVFPASFMYIHHPLKYKHAKRYYHTHTNTLSIFTFFCPQNTTFTISFHFQLPQPCNHIRAVGNILPSVDFSNFLPNKELRSKCQKPSRFSTFTECLTNTFHVKVVLLLLYLRLNYSILVVLYSIKGIYSLTCGYCFH